MDISCCCDLLHFHMEYALRKKYWVLTLLYTYNVVVLSVERFELNFRG